MGSNTTAPSDRLSRLEYWCLAGFTLVYFPGTIVVAVIKPLWNDELFTYHLTPLAHHELLEALKTGGEQLPPFFYLVTRASTWLFGMNELALRLPAIYGIWLMSMCLFLVVRRRTDVVHGVIAVMFPLVTGAYRYAYEARPYGLMLGFSAVALLAWQSAAEDQNRRLSLTLLPLSIAATVGCHYFGVFLVLPLCIGEAVRWLERKRLDPAVWLAFAAGMSPLLWWIPLLKAARGNSGVFWAPPTWDFAGRFYQSMLAPALPAITLALAVLLVSLATRRGEASNAGRTSQWPRHELAAYLGFIGLPVVATIAATLYIGGLAPRYLLTAVIGLCMIVPLVVYRLMGGARIVAGGIAVSLCLSAIAAQISAIQNAQIESTQIRRTDQGLRERNPEDLPIVLAHAEDLMRLTQYGSDTLKPKLVYLADTSLALKYLGHNTIDRSQLLLQRWFPGDVQPYAPFIASHARFLVWGTMGDRGYWQWILSKLLDDGVRLELKFRQGDDLLFLATQDPRLKSPPPAPRAARPTHSHRVPARCTEDSADTSGSRC